MYTLRQMSGMFQNMKLTLYSTVEDLVLQKCENTYFMFSAISMLTKNRACFKSPVTTMED